MANLGAISFTTVDLSTTTDDMQVAFTDTSGGGTADDTSYTVDVLIYGDDDAFTNWLTVDTPSTAQQAEITEILARYDGLAIRVDFSVDLSGAGGTLSSGGLCLYKPDVNLDCVYMLLEDVGGWSVTMDMNYYELQGLGLDLSSSGDISALTRVTQYSVAGIGNNWDCSSAGSGTSFTASCYIFEMNDTFSNQAVAQTEDETYFRFDGSCEDCALYHTSTTSVTNIVAATGYTWAGAASISMAAATLASAAILSF